MKNRNSGVRKHFLASRTDSSSCIKNSSVCKQKIGVCMKNGGFCLENKRLVQILTLVSRTKDPFGNGVVLAGAHELAGRPLRATPCVKEPALGTQHACKGQRHHQRRLRACRC